ncbi:TonB-dependent receptor [Rugamonas sp.]|uniref:TonB-dependent receptor n=1 Tax=Rugamonas sp. TaxID=1926287 RepID=UPI0025CBD12F|nr:TonB-dependent receptor [Rugamonas sp.]
MQRTPTLRTLPLILAGLFAVSAGASAADNAANTTATAVANTAAPDDASAAAIDANAPIQQVEVSGAHLKSARTELSPKVGTTVYTIDKHMVETLGQGDDTPFNEVLLRLPGVSQDSKASGSIHVRDDHGNVQYRINGVQLPESITGFGQSIDTRLVDQIDFITGALPAQFGLRTSGIVDVQTKEGGKSGGRVGVLVGGHDYVEPSAELFGHNGAFNYYLSASHLSNNLGIENPLPTSSAIHDQTSQNKTFGTLSYYVDDNTRLGLMFGSYQGHFGIPDNPGQAPGFSLAGVSDAAAGTSAVASSQLNEQQQETNRFFVLSLQKSVGDLNFQVSAFHQYSELHYLPDALGDLIYNGVASNTLRSNRSNGVQFDVGYKLNEQHTVRAGLAYTRQTSSSDNSVGVFATDAAGNQISATPTTIVDKSSKVGRLASVYVQDEWHISAPLTLNYGLRFDKVSAYVDEQQVSPRLNLAYKLDADTALHAGYSRYFTPPPQELASQASINLYANTTNAPQVGTSDNVKSERTHYFDAGLGHTFNSHWSTTADIYYKRISNLLDEGQFGQALILSPFNYEKGYAKGLELAAIYNDSHWGGFLNLTTQKAQGENIISGQSLFAPDELAYIKNHYTFVDHDQTYTVSGGAHYHFGESQISSDFLYGSGLRNTPDGAAPNSGTLAHYTTVNLSLTHTWKTQFGKVDGRLAMMNIFDKSYLLRDGSGVGVGAPQYGPRRTMYAGLSTSF